MPSTPQFGITYPCMSAGVAAADFAALATTTEAALDAVGFGSTPGTGEAYAVTHLAWGRLRGSASPAFAVEAVLTGVPAAATSGNGITVNAAAGTFTVAANGFYMASASMSGGDSTLTMTSQRVAVYVNGTLYAAKKTRGDDPVFVVALVTTYDFGVNLVAGDVVTFRYLWTGTGAMNNAASSVLSLSLLSRT